MHRIEALPGVGRYAVTFRRADGVEQTAVVLATGDEVAVAEASLPVGWNRETDAFRATAEAVLAVDLARRSVPAGNVLTDVEGGWDVGLGNVVLGPGGVPTCTAHGEMTGSTDDEWVCAECGARALLSS